MIAVLAVVFFAAADEAPIVVTQVSLNALCLEHVAAADYASASASCTRAADDVGASNAERATALVALGTSLAALNEDDVAVDAFVRLLVIDDTARLGDDAGAEAQSAFDRARARLLRDGAVRARIEQSEQADGRTVRIDVVIGADPLHRVAGAREVDDRGRIRMQASDDDRFTVEVQKASGPLSYRVELLGPLESVVLVDEMLTGAIGDTGSATEAPPTTTTATSAKAIPGAYTVAAAAAWDITSWSYAFDGGGVGDEEVSALSFVGFSVRADAQPLASLGYRWLGVDADLGLAALPFSISSDGLALSPSQFTAAQTRAGLALAARYTWDSGVAVGARAGYRYFGQSTELQTGVVDGAAQPLTIVPGFTFQGVALGVDGRWPVEGILFGQDLDLDARLEAIPLNFYEEQPDNPGAAVHGLGFDAGFGARAIFFDVAFAELRVQIIGASESYTEQGSRQALVGDGLLALQGGSVFNVANTISLGVGAVY